MPEPRDLAERVEKANALIREAVELLPWDTEHPVGMVQWVPIDMVQANDYNPNAVAHQEMRLLHTSIEQDGYTQPVVTIWDPDAAKGKGRYVIIDGFHRYTVMRRHADIRESTQGYLPVVVLNKTPAERIAATVRHNRARGKHSVAGMSTLVFRLLEEGQTDEAICQNIGLEPQELARLKYITGYAKLHADHEYPKAHLTQRQMKIKAAYKAEHPDETIPTHI